MSWQQQVLPLRFPQIFCCAKLSTGKKDISPHAGVAAARLAVPNYNAFSLNQVGEITLTYLYAMSDFYMQISCAESSILPQEMGFVDQNVFPCFRDVITCMILRLF